MKAIIKIFILGFFSLVLLSEVGAQDIIYLTDGSQVEGKVMEIGLNQIKYQMEGDGPLVSVRKSEVLRIKFENGKEQLFKPDPRSVNVSRTVLEKSRVIKFAFFSPLLSKLEFGYEQVIQPGFNLDVRAAWIGPRLGDAGSLERNPRGFLIAGGPKLWLGNDFEIEGMRYAHPLRGKYFKIEAAFAHFRRDAEVFTSGPGGGLAPVNGFVTHNGLALNLILGKQWLLGNVATLDFYGGMGYGWSSDKVSDNLASNGAQEGDYFNAQYFSHIFAGDVFPITLTSGLRIGVIF